MATAAEFQKLQTARLEESGWKVIRSGFLRDLGAVHVRDQYGCEGLVIQKFKGSDIGATCSMSPDFVAA